MELCSQHIEGIDIFFQNNYNLSKLKYTAHQENVIHLISISMKHDSLHSNRCNNSALKLRPSNTYMRHQHRPSLVQIMACSFTKPLSEPMLYWTLRNKLQSNFVPKLKYLYSIIVSSEKCSIQFNSIQKCLLSYQYS